MRANIEIGVFWLLACVSFFIPISSFISVRLSLVALFLSLIYFNGRNLFRISWDIILYLSILSLGLIYTINLNTGLRVLETSFSLLALPIIFSRLQNLNERKISLILYSFVMGLLISSSICLINAAIAFSNSGDIQAFSFYELTGILNLHPTYLAYYLIFGITFCLYLLFYKKGPINPLLNALIIVFFFFILMLTGGTTSFISLLFVFSFFLLKFLLDKNTREQGFIFVLVIMMMMLMFGINSIDSEGNQRAVLNDSWDRLDLWRSAISANQNILLGVGTGDYKDVLNEFYRTHEMREFASRSLNSHNQFIQIYFSNGLLGLVSVLILVGRPLYISFNENNPLGILIFFPFLIYGITEVFLGRYQGVVFFAFLHQMFIGYLNISKSEAIGNFKFSRPKK